MEDEYIKLILGVSDEELERAKEAAEKDMDHGDSTGGELSRPGSLAEKTQGSKRQDDSVETKTS